MNNIYNRIIDIAIKLLVSEQKIHKLDFLTSVIKKYIENKTPKDALIFLFKLQERIYSIIGDYAVKYGNGVHTKHRHINYHSFFTDNIQENQTVLDVGCGYGALAFSVANSFNNVNIYAVDISEKNIIKAKEKFPHENIHYICEDILKFLPNNKIDIIILSNVLEHLENRVEFLKLLKEKYLPEKILVRVPIFERDWTIPLKKELGINYFLDKTHFIEYTFNEFLEEVSMAKLMTEFCKTNWGELWAVLK